MTFAIPKLCPLCQTEILSYKDGGDEAPLYKCQNDSLNYYCCWGKNVVGSEFIGFGISSFGFPPKSTIFFQPSQDRLKLYYLVQSSVLLPYVALDFNNSIEVRKFLSKLENLLLLL